MQKEWCGGGFREGYLGLALSHGRSLFLRVSCSKCWAGWDRPERWQWKGRRSGSGIPGAGVLGRSEGRWRPGPQISDTTLSAG